MKKQLLIIATLALSLGLSSCKKDEDHDTPTPTPTPPPTNQLFITFTLDGVATNVTGTSNQLNTGRGSGSYTSSSFFDFTTSIDITLSMPQDSIHGSDLESLIGEKIPIGSCGGCPTNMNLSYKINGDYYDTYESTNPFPDNYFKITSVTFHKNVDVFDTNLNQYIVAGEFNVKLSSGSDIKNAPDGKFRMIFQEARY